MKRNLYIVLMVVATLNAWCQQLPQYSQYMLNQLKGLFVSPATTTAPAMHP